MPDYPPGSVLEHAPLYDPLEDWKTDPTRAMHLTVNDMFELANGEPRFLRCVDGSACELGRLVWVAQTQPPETLGKVVVAPDGTRQKRPAKNKDGSDIWQTIRTPHGQRNIQPQIDDVKPLTKFDRQDPRKIEPKPFHGDVVEACEKVLEVCDSIPETMKKHRYDNSLERLRRYGTDVLDVLLGRNHRNHIEKHLIHLVGRRMLFKIEELACHVGDPDDRLYGGVVIDNSIPILDKPTTLKATNA